MPGNSKVPSVSSTPDEIEAFVDKVAALGRASANGRPGRLIFALDATGSRQPTWDRATQIQGEMFLAAAGVGSLAIQLCFYRGFGEFKVARWSQQAMDLVRLMTSVSCRAGQTQIRKVLQHAINETRVEPVSALVFVGDCMEEDVDQLAQLAGQLGVLRVPAFMFHERTDAAAEFAFREIARLSGGAYCRFDAGSASQLRDLLRAVAVYAAGGCKALQDLARRDGGAVLLIAKQLPGR
jgi:hypothetical protein